MRITKIAAPLGACLMLATTGCGTGTGTSSQSSTNPSETSSATSAATGRSGGPVPSCVLGTWRSTSTNVTASTNQAQATVQGGSGVQLTIAKTGAVQTDFTGMQPVIFTATALGVNIKGQFSYAGTANGTVALTDSNGQTGSWEPVGQADWSTLRITAKLTAPTTATVLNNASVSDLTGDKAAQTGNAVDIQPILRPGSYTCGQNSLTIAPQSSGGHTVTWTFKRP